MSINEFSDENGAKQVDIIGLPIENTTRQEFDYLVIREVENGNGGWCCTVNLDILRLWSGSEEIRRLLSGVTHFVADGTPILWAARLSGVRLPERICGSDLIYSLSEVAAQSGKSVYLLGGNPGTAEDAGRSLSERYPGLKIAGTACPPMGFERSAETVQGLVDGVVHSRPDLVFVGLGFPKQERLIEVLRKSYPRAYYIGVGISFSFASGEVTRAPVFLQKLGLEWLHRLFQEPKRLWSRYLLHDIPFLGVLFFKLLFGKRTVR